MRVQKGSAKKNRFIIGTLGRRAERQVVFGRFRYVIGVRIRDLKMFHSDSYNDVDSSYPRESAIHSDERENTARDFVSRREADFREYARRSNRREHSAGVLMKKACKATRGQPALVNSVIRSQFQASVARDSNDFLDYDGGKIPTELFSGCRKIITPKVNHREETEKVEKQNSLKNSPEDGEKENPTELFSGCIKIVSPRVNPRKDIEIIEKDNSWNNPHEDIVGETSEDCYDWFKSYFNDGYVWTAKQGAISASGGSPISLHKSPQETTGVADGCASSKLYHNGFHRFETSDMARVNHGEDIKSVDERNSWNSPPEDSEETSEDSYDWFSSYFNDGYVWTAKQGAICTTSGSLVSLRKSPKETTRISDGRATAKLPSTCALMSNKTEEESVAPRVLVPMMKMVISNGQWRCKANKDSKVKFMEPMPTFSTQTVLQPRVSTAKVLAVKISENIIPTPQSSCSLTLNLKRKRPSRGKDAGLFKRKRGISHRLQ